MAERMGAEQARQRLPELLDVAYVDMTREEWE